MLHFACHQYIMIHQYKGNEGYGLMATQWGKTGWKIRHAFLPSYIPQGGMGLGRVDQM